MAEGFIFANFFRVEQVMSLGGQRQDQTDKVGFLQQRIQISNAR